MASFNPTSDMLPPSNQQCSKDDWHDTAGSRIQNALTHISHKICLCRKCGIPLCSTFERRCPAGIPLGVPSPESCINERSGTNAIKGAKDTLCTAAYDKLRPSQYLQCSPKELNRPLIENRLLVHAQYLMRRTWCL